MGDAAPSDAVTIVRDFYGKLASEETFPEALSLLDDDFVLHSPPGLPWGGEYRGPEGFVELMTRITGMVTPESEGAMEFLDAGDRTVMRATGRFVLPASGRSATTGLVEVFAVRDGKIIDMDIYYKDPATVAALVAQ